MLSYFRTRFGLRPYIAAAAAYGFALQVLMSGIVGLGPDAFAAAPSDQAFVICHGSGAPDSTDEGSHAPVDLHAHCLLCTLAKTAYAIVPDDRPVAAPRATAISIVAFHARDQVTRHVSPTGQFQRGPPGITFPAA